MISHSRLYILLAAGLVLTVPGWAQEGSPLPGSNTAPSTNTANDSAPVPGNEQPSQGTVDTSISVQSVSKLQTDTTSSSNSFLGPVSLTAVQADVQDLKNGGATEESLNKYLVWLDTLIKAHNKLAAAFAKQNTTSAACNTERNLSKQLYQVKDQVLYLKAQVLLKENRCPEAINILVDIIAVEPQSALGQQAYQRLVEAGFSPKSPTNTPSQLSHHSSKTNSY